MVNYSEDPPKDGKAKRIIWQIRTLIATIHRTPDSLLNNGRIEAVEELRRKLEP